MRALGPGAESGSEPRPRHRCVVASGAVAAVALGVWEEVGAPQHNLLEIKGKEKKGIS